MAFGFRPKHLQNISLGNLTNDQFLVIAYETIIKLNWEISYINENGLIAITSKELLARKAEFKLVFENKTVQISSSSIGSELIDWGKNKKNLEEFVYIFNKIKSSLTIDEIIAKYIDLKTSMFQNKMDMHTQPSQTTSEKISNVFLIFIPRPNFVITPLLIDINVIVFIIMCLSGVNFLLPDNESLIKWGSNFRPLTLEGQWWRLITSNFLHIGFFHLLLNMYALLYIGLLLEPYLGTTKFVSAYFLTAISASITSVAYHPVTISAGASGPIFGLYGVFLAMLTTDLIEKTTRKALLTSIGIFVGYNLLNGFKGGIDNAAHIGGLIGGLIIGYALIPSLREPEEYELKYRSLIYLTFCFIGLTIVAYNKIPNDIPKYDEKIKNFPVFESMAMEVLHNNTVELDSSGKPIPYTKAKMLKAIKERGLYYWNENIKLLTEIEKMNLPDVLIERNKKLLEYCQLRIKSFELIYKTIEDSTTMYRLQIENYNKQIDQIVNEIKNGN